MPASLLVSFNQTVTMATGPDATVSPGIATEKHGRQSMLALGLGRVFLFSVLGRVVSFEGGGVDVDLTGICVSRVSVHRVSHVDQFWGPIFLSFTFGSSICGSQGGGMS